MKNQVLILMLCLSLPLYAQYRPQHSLYMMNNYLLNPAITGVENYTDIQTGYRQQWSAIEGAPATLYVSIHAPIGLSSLKPLHALHDTPEDPDQPYAHFHKAEKTYHGLGGSVFTDRAGPFLRNEVNLSYAIHKSVSPKTTLSAGFSAGLIRQSLDPGKTLTTHAADPVIFNAQMGRWQPVMSVGFLAQGTDWYVGLTGLDYLQVRQHAAEEPLLFRHVYTTLAYRFAVTPQVAAQPMALLRWDRKTGVAYDMGMRFMFVERFWVGGAYRSSQEIVAMTGWHVNAMLSLGYAYDAGFGQLTSYHTGSHELMLSARLWKKTGAIPCPL